MFILARRGTIEPTMGFTPVLKAFIATVIGGLGSLSGAVSVALYSPSSRWDSRRTCPRDGLPFRDAFTLTS